MISCLHNNLCVLIEDLFPANKLYFYTRCFPCEAWRISFYEEQNMNKTLEKIKSIFTILITALAVGVMIFTIISMTTFNRNDRNLFGFKAFIVLSDSMKATDFAAGDVVFVRNVDPTTLQEGDIIAFTSQNTESYGQVVTHKIRSRTVDDYGDAGFITYGTSTGTDDETVVTYPYINGKYQFHIPKIGIFFQFLKTTPGYICCILIPFLILIGMQGLNTVSLFRQYRREQEAQMAEERAKIEEDKKQSEAMMAELIRLREQLAGGAVPPASPPAAQESEPKAEPEPENLFGDDELLPDYLRDN